MKELRRGLWWANGRDGVTSLQEELTGARRMVGDYLEKIFRVPIDYV